MNPNEAKNRQLRERYATDPQYRRKQIRGSAERWKRLREQAKMIAINGKPVRLKSTSEVSKEIGVHRTTIGDWIRKGAIPQPRRVGKLRMFSPQQVDLLRKLAKFSTITKLTDGDLMKRQRLLKKIAEQWDQ